MKQLVTIITLVSLLVMSVPVYATNGPVGILHLDELNGDLASNPINNTVGVIIGGNNWAPGKINNGFSFNGSSNYIILNRLVQDDFTICSWIKTTKGGSADAAHWHQSAIVHSEVPNLAHDFGFGIDQSGRLSYGNGGAYDTTINGDTVVTDNAWHYVCVTRNQKTGDTVLYIDGQADGSGKTDTATLDGNDQVMIGYGQDGAEYFQGIMDEVRFYDRVLPRSDIIRLRDGEEALPPKHLSSIGGYVSAEYLAKQGIRLENNPVSPPLTSSPTCSADQTLTLPLNIKALQNRLISLGFNPGPADGLKGPMTLNALKQAQIKLDTTPDGIAGPLTISLLNNSCTTIP